MYWHPRISYLMTPRLWRDQATDSKTISFPKKQTLFTTRYWNDLALGFLKKYSLYKHKVPYMTFAVLWCQRAPAKTPRIHHASITEHQMERNRTLSAINKKCVWPPQIQYALLPSPQHLDLIPTRSPDELWKQCLFDSSGISLDFLEQVEVVWMLQVPMLYGGRAEEGRRSRRQDLPPSRV